MQGWEELGALESGFYSLGSGWVFGLRFGECGASAGKMASHAVSIKPCTLRPYTTVALVMSEAAPAGLL